MDTHMINPEKPTRTRPEYYIRVTTTEMLGWFVDLSITLGSHISCSTYQFVKNKQEDCEVGPNGNLSIHTAIYVRPLLSKVLFWANFLDGSQSYSEAAESYHWRRNEEHQITTVARQGLQHL